MSKHANKRTRRRRRQHDRSMHDDVGHPLSTLGGVPVFDATVVEIVGATELGRDPDERVLLGIGPEGCKPRAYVVLCPCDGVRHLVDDLQRAGATAAEHHLPH